MAEKNNQLIDDEIEQFDFKQGRSPSSLPQINDEAIANEIDSMNRQQEILDEPEAAITPVASIPIEPPNKLTRYQEIIDQLNLSRQPSQDEYKRLQDERREALQNLLLTKSANQIVGGMAAQYGGRGPDLSEVYKTQEELANLPITQFEERQKQQQEQLKGLSTQVKTQKDITDLAFEEQMDNPKSDISQFYRERAANVLQKLTPNKEFNLENMTARQLLKALGPDAFSGSKKGLVGFGQFIDASTNHPLAFDSMDKAVIDTVTGEKVTAGTKIVRPIGYTDPLSGNRGYLTSQGMVTPGVPGLRTSEPVPLKDAKEEFAQNARVPISEKETTYSEVLKTAPKIAEKFDKIKEDFNRDMKESREVATAVTNLSSKLKPGINNNIDSGLLGSIQTQAAKMAGQKGVLTDQDLVKFAGAGGVSAKLMRLANELPGNMSDADIKFFKRFSELMKGSLNDDINNRSQLYTEQSRQLLDTISPGITPKNVSKMLGVDKVAPIVQTAPKNQVTIRTPSGTIMHIPKEKLQDALKKGALEVK